ncbi:hypothetical protein FKP32DRAFT_856042 [Trametes sanguinea]|nr:hypothetical protein FKP32DRAFT_856042 [Trametes sanguinea]
MHGVQWVVLCILFGPIRRSPSMSATRQDCNPELRLKETLKRACRPYLHGTQTHGSFDEGISYSFPPRPPFLMSTHEITLAFWCVACKASQYHSGFANPPTTPHLRTNSIGHVKHDDGGVEASPHYDLMMMATMEHVYGSTKLAGPTQAY